VSDSARQAPASLQQPEQLLGSQMQLPLSQAYPASQAAPAPQLQLPLVQPSAFEPQAVHAAPFAPQASTEPGDTQVLSVWQQPPSQLEASQTHSPSSQV